jgi:serine/threonine protein kinase
VLCDAQGRAKIADFGIAVAGESDGLTAAGTVLGTAAYISPEQASGDRVMQASDVYSFGVILYRMLTGRLPFESEDGLALIAMQRDDPPPPLSAFRPDAPARLESVAMAALAKSPADRPQDGAALLAELQSTGRDVGGETAATQILRPERRHRIRTGVLAAVLAAAGVGAAIAVTVDGSKPAGPPSSTAPPTVQPSTTPTTSSAEPIVPPSTTAGTTTAQPATTETGETSPPATTAAPTTAAPVTIAPAPLPSPPPPPSTTSPPLVPITTEPTTTTTPLTTAAPTLTDTATPTTTTPGPQG